MKQTKMISDPNIFNVVWSNLITYCRHTYCRHCQLECILIRTESFPMKKMKLYSIMFWNWSSHLFENLNIISTLLRRFLLAFSWKSSALCRDTTPFTCTPFSERSHKHVCNTNSSLGFHKPKWGNSNWQQTCEAQISLQNAQNRTLILMLSLSFGSDNGKMIVVVLNVFDSSLMVGND